MKKLFLGTLELKIRLQKTNFLKEYHTKIYKLVESE